VSIVSGSRVTFAVAGVYSITFSVQWNNSSNQIHDASIWLSKNGTTVPDTDSRWSITESHGGAPGRQIGTVNYVLKLAANDYLELHWQTTDTAVTLEYAAASAPAPAIPSVILTAAQVLYGQLGPSGATGPAGAQGIQGPQGIQGEVGASGATGPVGAQGPAGEPSTVPGPSGATGPQGPIGATGPGAAGIGVLTEFAGSGATQFSPINGYLGTEAASYLVTIDGTIQHPGATDGAYTITADNGGTITFATAPAVGALITVRVVRGQAGATGAQGAQGIQGIQGQAGAVGATGPQGTQGIQGDAGPVGATGPQGIQGDAGPVGATGPQGIQGIQGIQGPQGIQGEVGSSGATGPVGAQGPSGEPSTVPGPTGATGSQGIQGIQGPQGIQGEVGASGATGPGVSLTGVTAGTYGSENSVGAFTVNQFGQLTGATSSLIAISSAQITGVLATSQIPAITTSQLPASGVTPGTYGSSAAIPVLTVDALGRLTLASTASPASSGSIYDTVTLVNSGAPSFVYFDVLSQKNLFYTLPASGNYFLFLRGSESSTLNSLLSTTQGITVNLAVQNGSTARQLNGVYIDDALQPVAWNNSTNTIPTPVAGSISSWSFNIRKTANNTYTTLGQLNSFSAFGDPYFSNVNLLLHFDDSFADYKNANSFLTTGSPSINTSIVKFGSGSLLLPQGNNRLTYTPNSGNPFSVNTILNITFEFWIYISSIQQDQDVFFISNDDLNVGYKFKITNNRIPQWTNIAGTETASGNSAIPLNQWTHIAFRTGYQTTVFWINGVFGTFYDVNSTDGNKLIFYSSNNYQPVYIDDFRCTSNVQRYAYANFTPPLSAYPNF
jgi:hypothetical protein